jgi:hypothetical protein
MVLLEHQQPLRAAKACSSRQGTGKFLSHGLFVLEGCPRGSDRTFRREFSEAMRALIVDCGDLNNLLAHQADMQPTGTYVRS